MLTMASMINLKFFMAVKFSERFFFKYQISKVCSQTTYLCIWYYKVTTLAICLLILNVASKLERLAITIEIYNNMLYNKKYKGGYMISTHDVT